MGLYCDSTCKTYKDLRDSIIKNKADIDSDLSGFRSQNAKIKKGPPAFVETKSHGFIWYTLIDKFVFRGEGNDGQMLARFQDGFERSGGDPDFDGGHTRGIVSTSYDLTVAADCTHGKGNVYVIYAGYGFDLDGCNWFQEVCLWDVPAVHVYAAVTGFRVVKVMASKMIKGPVKVHFSTNKEETESQIGLERCKEAMLEIAKYK